MVIPQKPLITIIVPVYKVEKFINKCVKSILSQTFQDWELILVDDGSPDYSGYYCDIWAKKDYRIKVFHKENGGVSSARNKGLDHAKGDWICFIDSDDYVDEDYLNNLFSQIDIHTDLVYANYDSYRQIPYQTSLKIKSAINFMIEHAIFSMSGPVAKLYRAKLIHDYKIRFPNDIHMGEDAIFNIQFLNVSKFIAFTPCNNYHYINNQNSLSTKYYSFESEYNAYKLWKQEELLLFSKYYTLEEAMKITWNVRILGQFNRVLQCVFRHKPRYSLVKQIMLLYQINSDDFHEYNKYYHPTMLRRRFNKFLIVNRMFYIYVIIGLFDSFIYKGQQNSNK